MPRRIDLHIHTTLSDGFLTPKQVVDEANKNNVSVIAIADHDSIEAYNDELFDYAKSKNVEIINAVEISTRTNKVGIHVLGYNYDLNDEEFKEKLYQIRNARHIYLQKVARKLNELGYVLDVESLDKIEAVTKAHIALDIINNKENQEKLIETFGKIPSKGQFIETIMNENCPAFVKKETITPKEAAQIIRKAKGKVVLAHPVAYAHEDNLTDENIQEIVNDMQPDGIEANYIYVDRNDKVFDESKKWKQFAQLNNLFVTIGSDFHNKDGIRPEIGFKNTNFYLEDEEIEEILNNLKK